MENLGYILIGSVLLLWIFAIIFGLIAILPYGLVGLVALAGGAILLAKVIKERLANREDDHYSKTVQQ